MTKKTPVKCLHCLKTTDDWNWDHVFPESWYPDSTPPNLEKWQVPACRTCNSDYGKLERDLMIRIGLCLDPNDSKSKSIVQKAMRAIDPSCAKDEKDRAARAAKRAQILREIWHGKEIPVQHVYPGLGNRWNLPVDQQTSVPISAKGIRRINEKIIKGIFYLEDKRYVERPFKISSWAVHESAAGYVKALLDKFGTEYAREPGILVHRAVAPEDSMSSVYFIDIWGQFKMYGSIERLPFWRFWIETIWETAKKLVRGRK
jgi:hypothetical protein